MKEHIELKIHKYQEVQPEKLEEVNIFIIVCVINSSNFVSYILQSHVIITATQQLR